MSGDEKDAGQVRFIAIIFTVLSAVFATAGAQVIYQDDFEGAVSGWNVNATGFDPDTTRFLGRFDNSPNEAIRTFTIPPGAGSVTIEFNFYRFDSWDDTAQWGFDRFQIDIDGTQLFSLRLASWEPPYSGTTGTVNWTVTPVGPNTDFAFNSTWADQVYRVTLTETAPGPTLDLTIRTALNQGGNDESGGIDNFSITAVPPAPNIAVAKTAAVNDVLGNGGYATPGNEVVYTFTLTSTGGAVDADTIRLADPIPPELELFTGDFDGSGNPVRFLDSSSPASGMTCCASAHVAFSNTSVGPPVFGYTPNGSFDGAVTHIEITPSRAMRSGAGTPVTLAFEIKGRIR